MMKKFGAPLSIILLLITFNVFAQPSLAVLHDAVRNSSSDSARVNAYDALSKHYSYVSADSAIHYANKGLEVARESEDRLGEGMLLLQMASVYEKHNELLLADRYCREAMAVCVAEKYTNGIAGCNSQLGVIYARKGHYKEATEYFIKALKMYEQSKNVSGIVQANIKLGVVNEQTGNLDKALGYYTKAQRLNEGQPVSNANYTLLNSIGIIYARKGDIMKATQLFKEGVEQTNTPRHAGVHITLLGNLGNAYKMLGRIREAKNVQLEVMQKARAFSIPEQEARAMVNMADLIQASEPGESIAYLYKAIAIADTIQSEQLALEASMALSQAYKQEGDYKMAYTALQQYTYRSDSLKNKEKNREIAAMQANYDLEQSQIQVRNLTLQNEKRTLERNIVIIAAIGFLALMVFFWFYYQHTRMLNKKLEELNKVKDKLFSIIGHDLRGPLISTVQTMELMQSGILTEEENEMVIGELRKHNEATLDTLNSLLVWGKSQLEGSQINAVTFDAGPEVTRTIQALQRQAANKGITTSNWTAGFNIKADIDHFNFVVRNLLSNAIKFSHPEGHIGISASADEKEGTVVFSVKDQGVGIRKEQLETIFNDNPKINTGTSGEKGTGLGLVLCKEFVVANGGEIWVDIAPEGGTVFSFSLSKADIRAN